jgi:hypothetical protein
MAKFSVKREVLYRNADNFVVCVSVDRSPDAGPLSEKLSLLDAEIRSICNEYISTLDDTMHKKSPRPNPTPRIFIEQGNELAKILWLKWEA